MKTELHFVFRWKDRYSLSKYFSQFKHLEMATIFGY